MLKYVCIIDRFQERDQNMAKIGAMLYISVVILVWIFDEKIHIEKTTLLDCLALAIIRKCK